MDVLTFVALLAFPLSLLAAPIEEAWQIKHGGRNIHTSISIYVMLVDIVPFVIGVGWFAYRNRAFAVRIGQFKRNHPIANASILIGGGLSGGLVISIYYHMISYLSSATGAPALYFWFGISRH